MAATEQKHWQELPEEKEALQAKAAKDSGSRSQDKRGDDPSHGHGPSLDVLATDEVNVDHVKDCRDLLGLHETQGNEVASAEAPRYQTVQFKDESVRQALKEERTRDAIDADEV